MTSGFFIPTDNVSILKATEFLLAYPDHKHGTLDFVGGGSDKLGGDGVHRVVTHSNRRNQLRRQTSGSVIFIAFEGKTN